MARVNSMNMYVFFKNIVLCTAFLTGLSSAIAREESVNYRRCSLTHMLIQHPMYSFNDEITDAFKQLPWNERFNNHDLGVKVVKFSTQEYTDQTNEIAKFLTKAKVANRSIAKWFKWNKNTGTFNMDLVRERGLYDATELERQIASLSVRGSSILEDAGETLIPKTFLIMHDICYSGHYSNKAEDANSIGYRRSFSVKISSYIYSIDWNSDCLNEFYVTHYNGNPDFISNADYKYTYRAKVESTVEDSSNKLTQFDLIKQVVGRALDVNIVKLMKEYPDFRIMAPVVSVEPFQCYIGKKEGISDNSKFEVLEMEIDKNGVPRYNRKGIVKVKPGTIMDNRYSVEEPQQPLSPTEFIIESGSGLYPGMLIREL